MQNKQNNNSTELSERQQETEPVVPEKQPKTENHTEVVTVKFRNAGKQYDFDTNGYALKCQDQVVVETSRGRALGIIVRAPRSIVDIGKRQLELKKVLRLATEADINMTRISRAKEVEAFDFCVDRIKKRNLPMSLVKADYMFDGSKILFHFTAENRIDFRELVKDLAHHFHTRIEMRQIGVRDEAKLLGGLGICGRELCCSTFITEFQPVSVKMAKQQGLALNPNKISGQCGRLLCCLGYEYDTYCSMAKKLPKLGRKVMFEGQEATVNAVNILGQSVTLRLEGKNVEVPVDQLNKDPNSTRPDSATRAQTATATESTPSPKEDTNTQSSSGGNRGAKRSGTPQTQARGSDAEPRKDSATREPARPEGKKAKPDSRRKRPKQGQTPRPTDKSPTQTETGNKGSLNSPSRGIGETAASPNSNEQELKKRPPRRRNKRRPQPKPKE
ncbi:MAG: regulatory iron-sulfur-containing complex subunit RicT [Desulfuromonadaceae bacterium]|nr:regulatory iron-sulfur-containing complex subunit RicT [Desulfuromonas sp.]MDY0184651.1 regulatory iron-sulfur-containing complex subunit RicT [Desulfuromonadaceae bacterium]